jgi:hypothetical protein
MAGVEFIQRHSEVAKQKNKRPERSGILSTLSVSKGEGCRAVEGRALILKASYL